MLPPQPVNGSGEPSRGSRRCRDPNYFLFLRPFLQIESRLESTRSPGWAQQRQHVSLISAIDPEIAFVDGNNDVLRIQFAHSHQTQVRQIGLAVSIPFCKLHQSGKVISEVELRTEEVRSYQIQNKLNRTQMIGGFGQDWFACQCRPAQPSRDLYCPIVVKISRVRESDNETSIGNGFHERLKPLRVERFRGPLILPASRI